MHTRRTPDRRSPAAASQIGNRGRWAAKAMPFVFAAMWLLALLERLHDRAAYP